MMQMKTACLSFVPCTYNTDQSQQDQKRNARLPALERSQYGGRLWVYPRDSTLQTWYMY